MVNEVDHKQHTEHLLVCCSRTWTNSESKKYPKSHLTTTTKPPILVLPITSSYVQLRHRISYY